MLEGMPLRFWPSAAAVSLFGLVGVASLLVLLPAQLARVPYVPWPIVVALLIGFPWLFVVCGSALGTFAAPRVGLRSLAAEWASGLRPRLPTRLEVAAACALGILLGLAIAGVDMATRPLWLPAGIDPARIIKPWQPRDLVVGVGQGGIAEEIVTRWGIMSAAVWAQWRLFARHAAAPPTICFFTGNVVAALLFAAGHLPAAAQFLPLTPGFVTRTLVFNAVAGLVFGWQFQRTNLEMAMLAHAGLHLGFALFHVMLGP